MKNSLYLCIILVIASVLAGCGDNKITSKLIGTEMVNTPPAGGSVSLGVNTAQATVFRQTIQDMVGIQILAAVLPAFSNNDNNHSSIREQTIFGKALKTLGNKMKDSGGGSGTVSGTYSIPLDGGVVNYSYTDTGAIIPYSNGTGGTVTMTDIMATTFTNFTVSVGGSIYRVSGTETDNITISGNFTQSASTSSNNNGPTSVNFNYSLTATKGSITIAGPGCTGTWNYSFTNKATVSYLGGTTYFTAQQMAVSGTLGGAPVVINENNVIIQMPPSLFH